jgi:hypothetical protein
MAVAVLTAEVKLMVMQPLTNVAAVTVQMHYARPIVLASGEDPNR